MIDKIPKGPHWAVIVARKESVYQAPYDKGEDGYYTQEDRLEYHAFKDQDTALALIKLLSSDKTYRLIHVDQTPTVKMKLEAVLE